MFKILFTGKLKEYADAFNKKPFLYRAKIGLRVEIWFLWQNIKYYIKKTIKTMKDARRKERRNSIFTRIRKNRN